MQCNDATGQRNNTQYHFSQFSVSREWKIRYKNISKMRIIGELIEYMRTYNIDQLLSWFLASGPLGPNWLRLSEGEIIEFKFWSLTLTPEKSHTASLPAVKLILWNKTRPWKKCRANNFTDLHFHIQQNLI